MPPKKGRKKKKLTPEELEEAFETWKNEEDGEYQYILKLNSIISRLNLSDLDNMDPDMTVKTQEFLEAYQKIGVVFRVKKCKKLKTIQPIYLRTCFFGGWKGREEPFKIDGQSHNFEDKEVPVNTRNIRNVTLEIVKLCTEVHDKQADELVEYRKDFSNKFKRFVEFYKKHIKKNKSNEQCLIVMRQLIQPYEAVMECNMRLTLVDFQFQDEDKFDINNFKYKALITNFCTCYQSLQNLLLIHNVHRKDPDAEEKLLPGQKLVIKEERKDLIYDNSPDIYSILKKFQYSGWKNNVVEKYFIQQLHNSFLKMRVNMSKHYSMGFDFWRIPLSSNEQLMQDMTEVITLENEIEEILGDRLKREQLNFMYDVLKIVYDGPSRKKLLSKSDKILCLSIPKLVALKSLERIYEVFQAKYKEVSEVQKYKQHDIEPPKPLIDFALMSAINPREVKTHQGLLPQGHEFKEEIHLANDKNYTIDMNDNSIPDLDKYGRFFIWPDYIPEDMWDQICEKAKLLRHINRAALHDLEDFIIVQGMEASAKEMGTMRGNNFILHLLTEDQNKLLLKIRDSEISRMLRKRTTFSRTGLLMCGMSQLLWRKITSSDVVLILSSSTRTIESRNYMTSLNSSGSS